MTVPYTSKTGKKYKANKRFIEVKIHGERRCIGRKPELIKNKQVIKTGQLVHEQQHTQYNKCTMHCHLFPSMQANGGEQRTCGKQQPGQTDECNLLTSKSQCVGC